MKKTISLMLALMLLFSLCGCEEKTSDTADTTETTTATTQEETKSEEISEEEVVTESPVVYRTKTGKKYHRESCIHLKSKIETTVTDAHSMGLEPCFVCKPPQ